MPYVLTSTYDLYSAIMSRYFCLKIWFQRIPISNKEQINQILFEHDGVLQISLTGAGFIGISAASS